MENAFIGWFNWILKFLNIALHVIIIISAIFKRWEWEWNGIKMNSKPHQLAE